MPALITKFNPPRWRGVVTFNGKRKEKLFPDGSEKSKRAAEKWEDRQRRIMKKPTPTATGSPKLIDLANSYLDFVKTRQSRKTYVEKQGVLKRALGRFGSATELDDITVPEALKFLTDQYRKRSGYAANKERKVLISAWNWGRRYLPNFPEGQCPFQTIDRFPEKRQPRYVPSEEDFWKVYEVATGQDRVMLLVFLFLAARRSEVFRLKWTDIDFAGNTVTLWTRKRAGGDLEADPVPMVQRLKKVLMAWWEHRPIVSEYVFVNVEEHAFCKEYLGQPFTNRQHLMERLCKKAGVREFGFHSIRHLTASILYQEGQPVAVAQAVLRHKSPQTTTRYLQTLGFKQTHEAMEAVMGQRGPGKVISIQKAAIVFVSKNEKRVRRGQSPGRSVGWAFAESAWSKGSLRIFAGFAGFLQFNLGILPVGCAGLPPTCAGLECYLAVLTLMIWHPINITTV